jgi:hypothetical protein
LSKKFEALKPVSWILKTSQMFSLLLTSGDTGSLILVYAAKRTGNARSRDEKDVEFF